MNDFNKAYYDEKIKNNEEDIKSLNQRVDKLENVYVILEKQSNNIERLTDTTNSIDGRLSKIEQEPADKWKNITSYVITIVVGAILGFVLVKLGLK